MILAVPMAVGILLALVMGGRFSRLAGLPLRHLVVIVAGFLVQLAAIMWAAHGTVGSLSYRLVLMGGYALSIYGFWGLRRLPFMAIPLVGLALNLTVMVANGGTMVVTPEASAADGFEVVEFHGEARLAGAKDVLRPWDQTALPYLSDWITIGVGDFIRILAPGDVILAVGLGIVVFAVMTDITPSSLGWRRQRYAAATEA